MLRHTGTRRLVSTFLIAAAAASVAVATPPPRFERVPLRDTQMKDARDLAPAISQAGAARIDLPFGFVWEGRRYEQLEVGVGFARLGQGGSAIGSSRAEFARVADVAPTRELAAAGMDRATLAAPSSDAPVATATAGPTFEVLSGDLRLGPQGRVLIAESSFEVVVRWWDLRSATTPGSFAAELVLDRFGLVRYQYLQARGLKAAMTTPAPTLRAGIAGDGALRLAGPGGLAPGFDLESGFAILIARPDDAVGAIAVDSMLPPPPNCVPPTEDWCERADGPGGSTVYLEEGFSSPTVANWSATTGWHIIADTTCPPGASAAPGNSAYVGVDATCTWTSGNHRLDSPPFGPVTANTMLTLSSRNGFPSPANSALILVNGAPTWSLPVLPTSTAWYNFNPLSLAPFAGQVITISFLFNAPGAPSGIGWMLDDVFVWDDPAPKINCLKKAKLDVGGAALADCGDTLHNNWAFYETEFCLDCTYSFYLNVECGTEMHFPLLDMEGAELTVTDVINPTRVLSLTCENQAFRTPTTPPVAWTQDCCATPGVESWYGPAWSATDNNGPGSVTWGDIGTAPPSGCPSQAVYDLDVPEDGLQCDELPACGSVMTAISPGESQVIDCKVVGSPELCGLFRVDVRSGGNLWNLFSNCTGDATADFDIYYNCEDAWNAFNPLPEIAVANAREVGSCPNTQIEFDLQNLSCQDLTGDITVRATTNCVPVDQFDWVIAGGLVAGGVRTVTQPMTVSCAAATVTLTVDPLNVVAECSEDPTAAACNVIPGVDSTQFGACGCAGTTPPAASASQACEGQPTNLSCGVPEPGATYEWDFEDDGIYDATGCNVMHTYPAAGMHNARVRLTTAATCVATTLVVADVIADTPPNVAALLRGVKASPNGVHFEWSTIAGAASYRVARGDLANFYSHTVDDPAGIGQCDTAGLTTFDDPDDLLPGTNYYYLVAPLAGCGAAGPWGQPGDATPSPIPSASCP